MVSLDGEDHAGDAVEDRVQGERPDQAARDLNDFMKDEALTTDVSTLTKEIEKGVGEKKNEGVAR